MPSSRTYDADTTSSRPRSRRIGGWRSRSTSWPWRSDLLACGPASTRRASTRRNSAVGRVMVEGLSVAYRQEGAGEPVVTPTAYLAPFAGRPELRALLWALRSPRFEEFDETTAGLGRLRATPTLTAWANRDLLLPRAEMRRLLRDRKSTRLNSSHITISYAVFCLKKKKKKKRKKNIKKKKKKKKTKTKIKK